MKIALGSDQKTNLTDFVVEELKKLGHEVELFGPLVGEHLQWVDIGRMVAEKIARQDCEQGILFCWTGTGVSIAANKIPGVRAALCFDAETARGARKWNDANILVISLRLTSEPVAKEILESWFTTEVDESEKSNIEKISEIEKRYCFRINL
ncbi:MAG: putative sugar phosphate isomerase YwlF [candidate division WS2 bacterium]|uniref:Sugar phosphate isomerase YwlF n=1 Tax=Psychracetigena formicireducens TaxID=2986056 RepID=A0A9E2BIZ6_PSYF1|nr:putative sugar phosphate isomerase YwlF [Candidatus Psychracetigena formicireducens]MBT9145596.1 putative sugar phosphate isomerase YwlF [Candidatus Psychracetigena formicireducens]